MTDANNVLSNPRFDNINSRSADKDKRDKQNEKFYEKQQDKKESAEVSFAQMEGKCYCCRKSGHMSKNCRHKSKPKSEWVVNKAKKEEAHVQQQVTTNTPTNATPAVTQPATTTGWAGVHVHEQYFHDGGMRSECDLTYKYIDILKCRRCLSQFFNFANFIVYISFGTIYITRR